MIITYLAGGGFTWFCTVRSSPNGIPSLRILLSWKKFKLVFLKILWILCEGWIPSSIRLCIEKIAGREYSQVTEPFQPFYLSLAAIMISESIVECRLYDPKVGKPLTKFEKIISPIKKVLSVQASGSTFKSSGGSWGPLEDPLKCLSISFWCYIIRFCKWIHIFIFISVCIFLKYARNYSLI